MGALKLDDVIDGARYSIFVDDCYGGCNINVTAKFYKPGSSKGQLKNKFRFIDDYNRVIPAKYAESIELLEK